ncbi:uncharacterized protein LOC142550184 [Primulina tabacum]|uniref:uncharacterized protein LOC142550184 n=1 Tax=Primulina tabacum TaxID=48773 RepID=UPI003F590497
MKRIKLNVLLRNIESDRKVVAWQRVLEYSRLARSLLRKGILLVLDKVTKESCITLHLFLRSVYRLGRKSGWLYCALYLKQCMSSLKIAYGGKFDKNLPLSVAVSLTGKGYPRIIPSHVRRIMYKHDERADDAVRVMLTLLSFYTILIKGKKIKKTLFDTIRSPVQDIDQVVSWIGTLKGDLVELLDRYVPKLSHIPLNQGMSWLPSWKALPSYRALDTLWSIFTDLRKVKTPYVAQTMELSAYASLLKFIHARGEQWSSGILFPRRVRFAFDRNNKLFSGSDLDEFESKIGPYLPAWHPAVGPAMTGKLAQKVEGGGKRRVFAIGNWVNQRLLTPVHMWLAKVLQSIPMDGTFDQYKPLTLLSGSKTNYCFDLTAATDRWPLVLMFEVMVVLFDRSFASAVVNSALACNLFFIGFLDKSEVTSDKYWISFVAGQPLGYRSSWPLFALTHHIVVWWCAEQVYPGSHFTRYALLGDDIVISDKRVAQEYLKVLGHLQVKVSMSKSLISDTGCAEFAKRFLVRDLTKDLSSVTLKALLGIHIPICRLGLAHRYGIKRYSTFRRLGGAG